MLLILACHQFAALGLPVYVLLHLYTTPAPGAEDVVFQLQVLSGAWVVVFEIAALGLTALRKVNPDKPIFSLGWPGRVAQYLWCCIVGLLAILCLV